ncbi:hypothetical protein [Sphingobium sp. WCS2017Hpa-17]|uniref:hypothetical protein n=1 Tax=Sphingobium sp. WCS2017Hpa-17 TaxID=3073638 RepID=UPI002889294A|nr:hypothetical protein [Sphingobium sp. WCS2017Hpa-17]
MSAPIQTVTQPGALQSPDRQVAQGCPDSEAADRFRDALARKGKGKDSRPASAKPQKTAEDGPQSTPSPAQSPLVPLPFRERPASKKQDEAGGQDGRGGAAAAAPVVTQDVPAAAMPSAAPAADAGQFAAFVARLDAGLAPSAQSHLALPGDQWRADQVVIDSQDGGLSVNIDLGSRGDGEQETLKQLQARLRARGIEATVDRI